MSLNIVQQLIKLYRNHTTVMNKKLMSPPSIQQTINQHERNFAFLTRDQYLKSQCQIRENALQTAENLIIAYQKENQELKEENHRLKQFLRDKEESRLVILQEKEEDIKILQQNLLKYSQRINQLLEKNIEGEHKIKALEKQIDNIYNDYEAQQESKRIKQKLKNTEEKQRKEVQKHFKNYLKMAGKQDRLQSSSKKQRMYEPSNSIFTSKSQKEEKERNEIKVLSWKLKQKDEEILILLKRLRDMQSRFQDMQAKFHCERIVTSDTVEDYNTKKNVSEFCN